MIDALLARPIKMRDVAHGIVDGLERGVGESLIPSDISGSDADEARRPTVQDLQPLASHAGVQFAHAPLRAER
ncbi:hypothetical protein [Actinomadura sp. NEAU-AAG7]|uniref:hypothetical protein n=1 Tax=Actinomadura sp. NEAU-AAG7 TaxID=2839640 RepID=UPI001BE4BD73|nr:hypothetical protein [Actinomadura sp. NEAU-AAG7]MBT2207021.1 hypothetical protein [Actinomadura sp. NEAU-AAG7]